MLHQSHAACRHPGHRPLYLTKNWSETVIILALAQFFGVRNLACTAECGSASVPTPIVTKAYCFMKMEGVYTACLFTIEAADRTGR